MTALRSNSRVRDHSRVQSTSFTVIIPPVEINSGGITGGGPQGSSRSRFQPIVYEGGPWVGALRCRGRFFNDGPLFTIL